MAGKKYDSGKLRYDLLDIPALEQVIKALMFGANLYGAGNYRKVKNKRTRYWNAAMRHLGEYRKGVRQDKDSSLHPLAHAIVDCLFIVEQDMKVKK